MKTIVRCSPSYYRKMETKGDRTSWSSSFILFLLDSSSTSSSSSSSIIPSPMLLDTPGLLVDSSHLWVKTEQINMQYMKHQTTQDLIFDDKESRHAFSLGLPLTLVLTPCFGSGRSSHWWQKGKEKPQTHKYKYNTSYIKIQSIRIKAIKTIKTINTHKSKCSCQAETIIILHVYLHSMAFSRDLNVFGRLLRKFCILFKASIAVPECN